MKDRFPGDHRVCAASGPAGGRLQFEKGKRGRRKAALTWVADKAGDPGYQAIARLRLASVHAEAQVPSPKHSSSLLGHVPTPSSSRWWRIAGRHPRHAGKPQEGPRRSLSSWPTRGWASAASTAAWWRSSSTRWVSTPAPEGHAGRCPGAAVGPWQMSSLLSGHPTLDIRFQPRGCRCHGRPDGGWLLAGCAGGPDGPNRPNSAPNAALINVRLAWSPAIGPVDFPVGGPCRRVARWSRWRSSDGTVAAAGRRSGPRHLAWHSGGAVGCRCGHPMAAWRGRHPGQ
jgi:hypothetical protein